MWYILLVVIGVYLCISVSSLKISNDSISIKRKSTNKSVSQGESIPSLAEKPPLKVFVIVEPTPFTYISGYANRFKEMLTYLKRAGDNVRIFTPDSGARSPPPTEFLGFPITTVRGYEFPLYKHITLTYDLKCKLKPIIQEFKPDLIHIVTPSAVIWAGIIWAKVFRVPLLMSYHTDLTEYARNYVPWAPKTAMKIADFLIKFVHRQSDLTLCTSPQLAERLTNLGVPNVDVWRKGINTEVSCFLDIIMYYYITFNSCTDIFADVQVR